MTRSALALVDDAPWDMHRQLKKNCQLKFLHFQDEDPTIVNDVCTIRFVCVCIFDLCLCKSAFCYNKCY